MRTALAITLVLLVLAGSAMAQTVTVTKVAPGMLADSKLDFLAPHGYGNYGLAYDWDSWAPGVALGAPAGFGNSSFYANVVNGATNVQDRYRTLRIAPTFLFGRSVKVSEVLSMSYQTNKPAAQTAIDWQFRIYTTPGDFSVDPYNVVQGTGDAAKWYRNRIESAPANSLNLNAPAGLWNIWATVAGTNQLQFGVNRTGFTTRNISWDEFAGDVVRSGSTLNIANEELMMIDIGLGTNSGGGTGESQLDAVVITLTDGSSATLDLEGNLVALSTAANPLYVKPTDSVVVDLNVSDLLQPVSSLQAMLNFSSIFFESGAGAVAVQAGGGIWDNLLWNQWTVGGDLDIAVGVDMAASNEQTMVDATAAKITLDPKAEGATQVIFRADAGDTTSTWLAGLEPPYDPIIPVKADSHSIVIDGTAPALDLILPAANTCITGIQSFTFDFADANPLQYLEMDIFGPNHDTQETKIQATLGARPPLPEEIAYAANLGATISYDAAAQKWALVIDTTMPGVWADGYYTWYLEVADMAGNLWGDMMSPPAYAKVNWSIDNTAPVINVNPDDGAVFTAATRTITAEAIDPVAGVASFTYKLNADEAVALSTSGANSITLVLKPGANTVLFTATDNVGHVTTKTVTYTYNQPAPVITMRMSQAPNGFGSPSYPQWDLNAIAAIRDDLAGPVGTGYSTFADISQPTDYAKVIVTQFHTWNGLLVGDAEYGSRIHAIYKFDNGIRTNPGAAKLDLTKLWVKGTDHYTGTDNGQSYSYVHSDYQIASLSGRGQFGTNTRLRGYDWGGTAWVEVTSGTFADLIIYDNGEGLEPPAGSVAGQATLNALYKNMAGAVAWPEGTEPDALILQGIRARYSSMEFEVRYDDGVVLPSAIETAVATLDTDDAVAPAISITSLTDGQKTNDATQTIAGTVTDLLNLASGVKEVKVFLNGAQVGATYNASDPVSFSEAVTLAEGTNTIKVTAEDFGGNPAEQSITVLLDTVDPSIAIVSYPDADPVTQGTYDIVVEASDASAGLADGQPVVTVDGCTVTGPVEGPTGTFTFQVTIDANTTNGDHLLTASVTDGSGNTTTVTETITVNKNQITGSVEMEGFVGGDRAVTFVATDAGGAVLKTWSPANFTFSGASAQFTLTDVPDGTASLSAKTAWSLRSKVACADTGNGQLTAALTGDDKLLGGDFNNTNSVNVLDYSIMKVNWMGAGATPERADIDGSGSANDNDYVIMKGNWFKTGDAL